VAGRRPPEHGSARESGHDRINRPRGMRSGPPRRRHRQQPRPPLGATLGGTSF